MKIKAINGKGFFIGILLFSLLVVPAHAQMFDHSGMDMGKSGSKEKMGHGKSKEGYGMKKYSGSPFDIDMFKDHLDLSEDQVKKLKKVRLDYRKALIMRKAELRVLELELWELIDVKDLNMGKIEKKLKEVHNLKGDIMLYRIRTLNGTKKVLSDEQYAKFRKMGFRSMRQKMGRHGMSGGMGGGYMGPMGYGMKGGMHNK